MRLVLVLVLLIGIVSGLDNGLGLTPAMGWNSWNHYGCNINETVIRETALTMKNKGFAAKGYQYVNIDDCWQVSRDPNTGVIQADPETFPSGIKALADYVHSLGLKLGIYSDAGTMTCQKRPGSMGYEMIDAATYASWGIDYLKYDNCHNQRISAKIRYPIMTQALNQSGRAIYFSMCEWGFQYPWLWANNLANSWRTTPDIKDQWYSVLAITDINQELYNYSYPGAWNDPDMLEVGNGGLSFNEEVSHFCLWSIMKSPLILGCDINNITQQQYDLLTNEEIIAINQDPLGVQARVIKSTGTLGNKTQVWAGPLSKNEYVVMLFNKSVKENVLINFTYQEIGFKQNSAKIRDLVLKKDLGTYLGGFSAQVPYRSVVLLRLTPLKQENLTEQ